MLRLLLKRTVASGVEFLAPFTPWANRYCLLAIPSKGHLPSDIWEVGEQS